MNTTSPSALSQDARGDTAPASPDDIPGGRRRIGEVLVAAGVLTPAQLQRALVERTDSSTGRERLGSAIVRVGFASEEDIARALSTQLGLPFVSDEDLVVNAEAAARVPAFLAQRHQVLGVDLDADETLTIATADPTNVLAVDDIRMASKSRRIKIIVVTERTIAARQKDMFVFGQGSEALLDLLDEEQGEEDAEAASLLAGAEDAPIVRLADGILNEAVAAGASDVHIEPTAEGTVVRHRIDGVLHKVTTVPKSAGTSLMSRLKLMSDMDIAERRRPQDGRARIRGAAGEVDLRASTMPSMHGETMVMRLLKKGGDRLRVADVGLSDEQRTVALDAASRPQGMVLITGPTGSGKTSTLYAFLAHLANETHNIITLEDPVEYELGGINQTQISEKIGLTFGRALRSVLRQDPDIVMLGEIRDPEAAEIAIQASLTGHMVLSTLHTNDAAGAIVRLLDLDVPNYLITSALTMVMAQRLARRICPHCSKPTAPSETLQRQLHLSGRDLANGEWRQGTGCTQCRGSGYQGRVGLFEVMEIRGRVREALSAGGNETSIRTAARQSGALSLREDGLNKARAGHTTLEEVLRVTPADPVDRGTCPTCGLAVETEFAHCPWCASNLRGLRCVDCDHELAMGWMACPGCGLKIAESTP